MLRKYLMAAGLSAAALGVTLPSAASAQYYGHDRGPRTSLSVSIGSGYSPGYYGQSYYGRGYGYYGNDYRYDRRDWRDDRRQHRHEHRDHDRDRDRDRDRDYDRR